MLLGQSFRICFRVHVGCHYQILITYLSQSIHSRPPILEFLNLIYLLHYESPLPQPHHHPCCCHRGSVNSIELLHESKINIMPCCHCGIRHMLSTPGRVIDQLGWSFYVEASASAATRPPYCKGFDFTCIACSQTSKCDHEANNLTS